MTMERVLAAQEENGSRLTWIVRRQGHVVLLGEGRITPIISNQSSLPFDMARQITF